MSHGTGPYDRDLGFMILPVCPDLLRTHSEEGDVRERSEFLKLNAWPLSDVNFRREVFSKDAADLAASGRRATTNTTYSSRLAVYYRWCDQKGHDPLRATLCR